MGIKKWIYIAVFCQIVLTGAATETETILLGDESDGSRAIPIHRIPLLDEEGMDITPSDDPLLPFSTRQTCSANCHSYEKIASGWHFNSTNPNAKSGRPGSPWIYLDIQTGVQIPLSYRSWPGAFQPTQIGLTPRNFIQHFGRHLPGGGRGRIGKRRS